MQRLWHLVRFGLIERYVFRMAFFACVLGIIVLTAVIWVTQALRELDLMTSKGQTILMFLAITGLSIPALVTVIAPVALFAAVVFTLNKLNSDSELIVMNAAGTPPSVILKPLALLGASDHADGRHHDNLCHAGKFSHHPRSDHKGAG